MHCATPHSYSTLPSISPDHDCTSCKDTEAKETVMGQTVGLTVASNTLKFTEEAKVPDPGLQTKLVHRSTKVPPDKAREKGNWLPRC